MLTINLLQVVNGIVASVEKKTFNLLSSGKIFVDVSNRTEAYDGGSSHAEYLAKLAPTAHVVKGFNVISAWALENDVYGGSKMVYLCGDNAEAKEKVCEMSINKFLIR